MEIDQNFFHITALTVTLKRYAKSLNIVISFVAIAILLGWQFDLDIIKRPIPGLIAMNPMTAICFLLVAVTLWIVMAERRTTAIKALGYFLMTVVFIISFLRIWGSLSDFSPQIDELLYRDKIQKDNAVNLASRMAPNTAMNFLLIVVMAFFMKAKKRMPHTVQVLAITVGLIGIFSVLGYVYEVKEFYGILTYLPMAVHTAICFLLLASSILFFTCDQGLFKEITSPYAGGLIGRFLIPIAIIVPSFMGYLRLFANWNLDFSVEFGAAVLVLSIIIIFVSLIWFVVYRLNRKDRLQKMAEKELRLAYSLLQSSMEGHKDVLIFSMNTNYQFLNFNSAFKKATINAYGTKVTEGISVLDSISNEEEKARVRANCDLALSGKSHTTIEAYGELTRSYFETKYNPIKNVENEIIGVTVLSSDITERKKSEEEIVALNKELEAFSYSVAHDLRAPLRIIDGYSGILMEDYHPTLDAECQRLLKVIARNSRQMGQLIDDLLKFSKLGRRPVHKSDIDIRNMIEGIIEEQQSITKNDNIEIKLGKLDNLYCDRQLINHVFYNLISNAIKYSGKKENPVIEIGSSKDTHSVTYFVRDNGAGFDMKYADKLFGVFQRLHSNKDFEGTGVGLAIVQRIITKHSGTIWAEAEVNKGATFYINLPLT